MSESFRPRSIGRDVTPGCFVCGGNEDLFNNVAAFVSNKDSGKRVVSMFHTGAWLDYRPSEPNWIQVKIGACDRHLPQLRTLLVLTSRTNEITIGHVDLARTALTLQDFTEAVRCVAFQIYKDDEKRQSDQNWLDAMGQLLSELRRFPTEDEITKRAYRLWEERRTSLAEEYWLVAELEMHSRVIVAF